LIIDKYIQVKHNTVAGIDFKVDGKVILGAKFKNYKLSFSLPDSPDSLKSLIFSAILVNPTKVFVTSLAFSCLISVPVN
jgi:hypothetical protein